MLKKLKTFNYDDKNYVILKDHSCSNSRAQLIGIDTDLSAELLFCEDFHP